MTEGSFVKEYRITPQMFNILVNVLEPLLKIDESMAALATKKSGSGEITMESRVGQCLILLGGGRIMEVMRTHGVSAQHAYWNFHRVVDAINQCSMLDLFFEISREHLARLAEGFRRRSFNGLFQFCVGALDGIAIAIKFPSRRQARNQTRFYSGSKKKACLNVQAVCDAMCRFYLMCAKHCGSTNDSDAFNTSTLSEIIALLLFPYHINGDNAYPCTEQVMVPFAGVNLHLTDPVKETYNFYHSQLRITIERAFGLGCPNKNILPFTNLMKL